MPYALNRDLTCLLGICFFAHRTGDGQNPDRRRGVRGYAPQPPADANPSA